MWVCIVARVVISGEDRLQGWIVKKGGRVSVVVIISYYFNPVSE